jgi:23S rRNA (pseudouridine1915-N3)-methyltransferase
MSLQINIITPGSSSKEYLPLINEYLKRATRYAKVTWEITKGSDKKSENEHLRKVLVTKKYIVLDEHGKNIKTEDIANEFSAVMQSGNPVINLVIGGAYGLDDEIISGSSASWAFGKITLPHQLVRLITAEQIYRALTIINNHPYHHS